MDAAAGMASLERSEDINMEESSAGAVRLPPGVQVLVLGPASAGLVQVLWGAGLRPVRGRTLGTLWALPGEGGRR